jgi:hypothetical protein
MGGLFRAPKPTIVEPPPVPTTITTVATPAPSAAQQGEQTRAAAQAAAAQSGIASTIATSPTGVLTAVPSEFGGARKSLLGE